MIGTCSLIRELRQSFLGKSFPKCHLLLYNQLVPSSGCQFRKATFAAYSHFLHLHLLEMILQRFVSTLFILGLLGGILARAVGGKPNQIIKDKRALQDIVTWDEHSIFIRGERLMLFNGEFHPYRLPSPGLWLDVFQKVKALGFSGVSFYTDWALHEGKEGNFTAEGVFALEPFFAAASEAGIYLVARPGRP